MTVTATASSEAASCRPFLTWSQHLSAAHAEHAVHLVSQKPLLALFPDCDLSQMPPAPLQAQTQATCPCKRTTTDSVKESLPTECFKNALQRVPALNGDSMSSQWTCAGHAVDLKNLSLHSCKQAEQCLIMRGRRQQHMQTCVCCVRCMSII